MRLYVNNSASYRYMEGYMIDRELLEKEALAEIFIVFVFDNTRIAFVVDTKRIHSTAKTG